MSSKMLTNDVLGSQFAVAHHYRGDTLQATTRYNSKLNHIGVMMFGMWYVKLNFEVSHNLWYLIREGFLVCRLCRPLH